MKTAKRIAENLLSLKIQPPEKILLCEIDGHNYNELPVKKIT